MIEKLFPKTVSNIIDYQAISDAAKVYVEEVFVQICESFGNNLLIKTMDESHLPIVARNVMGRTDVTAEELLDYMNSENTYREYQFVEDLQAAFPEGVEYKEFDVTGWQFPDSDFDPFTNETRSHDKFGNSVGVDEIWEENAQESEPERNFLMSRFKGQFEGEIADWHRKSGRRASWGNEETWMTTGGFGKPASIHINVDEIRSVIETNGLTAVENWIGTVSYKLPINLYIEINDEFRIPDPDSNVACLAGSSDGYAMSFPYEEEDGFCTNDPDWPREVYYEGDQAFDNKGNSWTVIPDPQPDPEPPGPDPGPGPGPGPDPGPGPGPEPIPDFSEQGITGTIRIWGNEVSSGTEFIEYGNVRDGVICMFSLPTVSCTPPEGGIIEEDE